MSNPVTRVERRTKTSVSNGKTRELEHFIIFIREVLGYLAYPCSNWQGQPSVLELRRILWDATTTAEGGECRARRTEAEREQ